MAEQPRTYGPVSKGATTGATTAGAAGIVLVWILEATTGIDVPTLVEGAIPVLLAGGGAALGGWLVRPGSGKRVAG
ncbi:hypothetical protein ACFY5D_18150 [Paeniglutamicibacter sp. NPDC012692]|uniref:hypothetical protein n=1 Tax=Paeniglutamicibacter sp. NPDC012692 TaxID=3364388 RepID=UPI00369D967C